jgi:uncharacterized protein YuzE
MSEGHLRVTYLESEGELLILSAVKKKKGWGWSKLRIEYDKEADALYIQLREVHVDDNIDLEEGISIDLDEKRHVVGIEILDASMRLSLHDMANITIANLPLEKAAWFTVAGEGETLHNPMNQSPFTDSERWSPGLKR